MYRPVLVTPPSTTPVSLTDVKAQLDISYSEKDTYLTGLINAAVSYVDGLDGVLGKCLISQTWRQDFDCFSRCLRLPLAPVNSITNIKYDDADSEEQTIAAENYELLTDELGPYVRFGGSYSYPSLVSDGRAAVRVTFVAGFGAAATDVPPAIRHLLLLLIRHWFDNPGAVVVGAATQVMPLAVEALIATQRRTFV